MTEIDKDKVKFNRKIKGLLLHKGITYVLLAELLKAKYGYDKTSANIAKKIRSGTISHIELVKILDILGYDVEFVDREKE